MAALDELLKTRVARFVDRQPDWDAFADARVEGYRRAQHRYIGTGASGKTDTRAIPAEQFTLSVMFVPPGQGNAAHTHEVEEVFFILDGKVKVFFEDGAGRREETVDRKSTRLNSSHVEISYAVFCLKKKKKDKKINTSVTIRS